MKPPPKRCDGKCCERFPLSIGYWMNHTEVVTELLTSNIQYEDRLFVADMLVPFIGPPDNHKTIKHWFTCKHFDGTDCTVYEYRPGLCRRHGINPLTDEPDGHACDHSTCALKPDRPLQKLVRAERLLKLRDIRLKIQAVDEDKAHERAVVECASES